MYQTWSVLLRNQSCETVCFTANVLLLQLYISVPEPHGPRREVAAVPAFEGSRRTCAIGSKVTPAIACWQWKGNYLAGLRAKTKTGTTEVRLFWCLRNELWHIFPIGSDSASAWQAGLRSMIPDETLWNITKLPLSVKKNLEGFLWHFKAIFCLEMEVIYYHLGMIMKIKQNICMSFFLIYETLMVRNIW